MCWFRKKIFNTWIKFGKKNKRIKIKILKFLILFKTKRISGTGKMETKFEKYQKTPFEKGEFNQDQASTSFWFQ